MFIFTLIDRFWLSWSHHQETITIILLRSEFKQLEAWLFRISALDRNEGKQAPPYYSGVPVLLLLHLFITEKLYIYNEINLKVISKHYLIKLPTLFQFPTSWIWNWISWDFEILSFEQNKVTIDWDLSIWSGWDFEWLRLRVASYTLLWLVMRSRIQNMTKIGWELTEI